MSYGAVKAVALRNVARMVNVVVWYYLLLGQCLSCVVYGIPWGYQIIQSIVWRVKETQSGDHVLVLWRVTK